MKLFIEVTNKELERLFHYLNEAVAVDAIDKKLHKKLHKILKKRDKEAISKKGH